MPHELGPAETKTFYVDAGADYSGLAQPTYGTGDGVGSHSSGLEIDAWYNSMVVIGRVGKFDPTFASYLRFRLDSIPADSTITSAKLVIESAEADSGILNVKLAVLNRDDQWDHPFVTSYFHPTIEFKMRVKTDAAATVATAQTTTGAFTLVSTPELGVDGYGNVLTISGAPAGAKLGSVEQYMARVGTSSPDVNFKMEVYSIISGATNNKHQSSEPIAVGDADWRQNVKLAESDPKGFNSISTSEEAVAFTFSGANQIPIADGDVLWFCHERTHPANTPHLKYRFNNLTYTPNIDTARAGVARGKVGGFHSVTYMRGWDFPYVSAEANDTVITAKVFGGATLGTFSMPARSVGTQISYGDASTSPTHTCALAAKLQSWIDTSPYDSPHGNRYVAFALDPQTNAPTQTSFYAANHPTKLGPRLEITYQPAIYHPPDIEDDEDATPYVPVAAAFLASETSIANAALIILGERRISDLGADTKTAKLLAERYDDVRDELLRLLPWTFATTRGSLPLDATPPAWGYTNAFSLPVDCLRLIDVDNPHDSDWTVEGRRILASFPAPLDITYTRRVVDPMEMDVLFRETLAAALASEIAEAITGDRAKIVAAHATLGGRIAAAAAANGQEDRPKTITASEWVAARGRED